MKNSNTSVISRYKTLIGWSIVWEGPTHELLVEGTLDLAGNLIVDVVHYGVQVAWIGIVGALVGAIEVTFRAKMAHKTRLFRAENQS